MWYTYKLLERSVHVLMHGNKCLAEIQLDGAKQLLSYEDCTGEKRQRPMLSLEDMLEQLEAWRNHAATLKR